MAIEEQIHGAVSKIVDLLIKKQNPNGSWEVKTVKITEPSVYQKDLIVSSQALQTLILSGEPRALEAINKALHFCMMAPLKSMDAVDLWAFKLRALEFSDIPFSLKQREKIANFIASQQTKEGYWGTFPTTFNLTNFSVCMALKGTKFKTLQKAADWFKKSMAADGKGWGADDRAKESEVSFTSNIVHALLIAGEDPLSKEMQTARKFLESKQFKNGGWASSKLTIADRPTTYSTAMTCLAYMQLADNPLDSRIEKAIKFLLHTQEKGGFWSLDPKKTASGPSYYIEFYAVNILKFYEFVKKQWKSPETQRLRKIMKPQHVMTILLQRFEHENKRMFVNNQHLGVFSSKILGTTKSSIKRRIRILKILEEEGPKELAEIIDSLKEDPKYSHLSKKAHMTLIKNDVDYLKSIRIVWSLRGKIFSTSKSTF